MLHCVCYGVTVGRCRLCIGTCTCECGNVHSCMDTCMRSSAHSCRYVVDVTLWRCFEYYYGVKQSVCLSLRPKY